MPCIVVCVVCTISYSRHSSLTRLAQTTHGALRKTQANVLGFQTRQEAEMCSGQGPLACGHYQPDDYANLHMWANTRHEQKHPWWLQLNSYMGHPGATHAWRCKPLQTIIAFTGCEPQAANQPSNNVCPICYYIHNFFHHVCTKFTQHPYSKCQGRLLCRRSLLV